MFHFKSWLMVMASNLPLVTNSRGLPFRTRGFKIVVAVGESNSKFFALGLIQLEPIETRLFRKVIQSFLEFTLSLIGCGVLCFGVLWHMWKEKMKPCIAVA